LTVTSGNLKYFGTLFVDSQDNIPSVNGCTYELSLSSGSTAAAASNLPILVVTQAGCLYRASDTDSFVSPGAGSSGTAVISIGFSRNTGAARSTTVEIAGQPVTFTQASGLPVNQVMSLSHTKLQFGYSGQQITGTQTVALSFNPPGATSWTASSNQSNITVSPASGTGNAALQITGTSGASGVITVTAAGATNSPQQIQVNVVNVAPTGPFGSFDTPVNNTTGIAGAIPVTGWALDNVEVASVGIWREPIGRETPASNGLVYIGDATFVSGARPDIESTYPNAPLNYRAGWGYMLLTNFLANSSGLPGTGNGIYKLHAIATDKAGMNLDLGTRTITVDNAHASKPFGTIDTPAQGATVAGNAFVNFGWALTQSPYVIPTNGSLLTVYVDGVPLGHPAYNQYRSDIATLFPGLANSNGGVGFFYIDTTTLANGVHTIAWSVSDNGGRTDGIGSRYFTVQNTGTGPVAAPQEPIQAPSSEIVLGRGFDPRREAESLSRDAGGRHVIHMEEVERIELQAGATTGYSLVNGERRPLPIGSTLKGGVFYWQAGPGFLGEHQLVFERPAAAPASVRILIHPKNHGGREVSR
jgi:hypothetical protein